MNGSVDGGSLMGWEKRPDVTLGGKVWPGASVTYGPQRPMYGLRRPAPRTASIEGFAQRSDLIAIHEQAEERDPVAQSGVFADGVMVFVVGVSIRPEDVDLESRGALYEINVLEARMVTEQGATTEGVTDEQE